MAAGKAVSWSNIAASKQFSLEIGGYYELAGVATWGGGNIEVQALGPDGTTYLSAATATKLTANGRIQAYLPPGSYQLTVTTASAIYASLTRMPLE